MEKFQYKPDILVEVFLFATPWDLLQLHATCRSFNNILNSFQNIWRLSRRRLSPPVPDPKLPPHLFGCSRRWAEPAYAQYIFGNSKCTFCGDEIDEPWVRASFSLRLFPCSKSKQCKMRLHRDTRTLSGFLSTGFENKVKRMKFCQAYMPFLEFTGKVSNQGEDLRCYTASQFKRAQAEWEVARDLSQGGKRLAAIVNNPEGEEYKLAIHINIQRSWRDAYMQTAEALARWQSEYLDSLESINVFKWNISIGKRFAKNDRMKFSMVERSSTFKSYILSLSRMQTTLELSDWQLIRKEIYRDMQDEAHGIMKFPIPKDWRKPVVCPLCEPVRRPRLFEGSSGLLDHAMRKHKGVDRTTLVKNAWK